LINATEKNRDFDNLDVEFLPMYGIAVGGFVDTCWRIAGPEESDRTLPLELHIAFLQDFRSFGQDLVDLFVADLNILMTTDGQQVSLSLLRTHRLG
jgi:hypothetical protein